MVRHVSSTQQYMKEHSSSKPVEVNQSRWKKVWKILKKAFIEHLQDQFDELFVDSREYREDPQETYGRRGKAYNYERHPKSERFLQAYFEELILQEFLVEVKHLPPRSSLLDLGSGVGEESDFLRKRFPEIDLVSFDPSNYGVKSGKEKGLTQIQGEAEKLPFGDGTFSAIHCKDVLVHIRDKRKFFQEIARILKTDGVFILVSAKESENFENQYPWTSVEIWREAEAAGLEVLSKERFTPQVEDWYVKKPRERHGWIFKKRN